MEFRACLSRLPPISGPFSYVRRPYGRGEAAALAVYAQTFENRTVTNALYFRSHGTWLRRPDLNREPEAYETSALPLRHAAKKIADKFLERQRDVVPSGIRHPKYFVAQQNRSAQAVLGVNLVTWLFCGVRRFGQSCGVKDTGTGSVLEPWSHNCSVRQLLRRS